MSRLRSPRLMLALFVVLLIMPRWAPAAVAGVGALLLGARVLRSRAGRRRGRRAPDTDAIRLGTGPDGRIVTVGQRELSAHTLILGASGSGKTTALLSILTQQIAAGLPVVAIDMKGSPAFSAQLAAAAAAAGRPFKLWTPDGPASWNPLQHGNATEGKDKLVSTERFSEPHYQRAAERYVQTLLQVLQRVHPDRAPRLDEVVAFMNHKRLPGLLRQVPEDLADRVQDYLAELSSDQVSAVRGLQTRLALITESDAGKFLAPMREPTIDLRAALEGRDVVLFSLNSSRYGKFAAQLGTLIVQDLICVTGLRLEGQQQGGSSNLAMVAIDEFSGIGGEHVVALFARGREAGVGALVATQEMVDLDRAGRGVREQVMGNTALKLVFRQDVPESALTVARIAGTEKVWEETHQIAGGTLFGGPTGRGTRREVERFIIDPNQVKSLATGEAVVISKLRAERPRLIRVTPPAVVAPASAPPATPRPPVSTGERDGFDPNTGPFPSRSLGRAAGTRPSSRRVAGARSESARAKDVALSERSPRSRYPDPGVTR